MLKQQPTQAAGMIHVESMVASQTKEPRVILQWAGQKGELTPAEARAHALILLEVAEAAETDALIFKWAKSVAPEVADNVAADILMHFRAYRETNEIHHAVEQMVNGPSADLMLKVIEAAEQVERECVDTSWNIGAIHELIEAIRGYRNARQQSSDQGEV